MINLLTILVISVANLAIGILPHVDNMDNIGGLMVGSLIIRIHSAATSSIWSIRAPTYSCWCSPEGEIQSIPVHVGDFIVNPVNCYVR